MTKVVAIVSGGLDSTVLAYQLKHQSHDLHMVSFNYGQKHVKELDYARVTASELDAEHHIIDLTNVQELLKSALTDRHVAVPEGHYADESMRLTVVPNRNAIMLSIATGIAVAEGAAFVATGVHAGDHPVYPDCRPVFIDSMSGTMQLANEGFAEPGFTIEAPFVHISKADIVSLGDHLQVPWQKTWSCYKGEAHHCGKCGTCVERIEAFSLAGVVDPTLYESEGYTNR
jgi:7-cyano-7-deazaguanine synthase